MGRLLTSLYFGCLGNKEEKAQMPYFSVLPGYVITRGVAFPFLRTENGYHFRIGR